MTWREIAYIAVEVLAITRNNAAALMGSTNKIGYAEDAHSDARPARARLAA